MKADKALAKLVDILTRENAALRTMNVPAAVALAMQKQAALSALEASPAPKTAPRPAFSKRLVALVAENRTLLERAMRVQRQVIEIVAGAYKPAPELCSYGPNGEPNQVALSGVALSTRV